MISVLMSVYNEKPIYLEKAIKSILNQTYKDIEFIIVLDSPDNNILLNIIQQFSKSDNRIRILINEENIGLALSLNKAIHASNGQYLARMDSDDISKPERLERELKFLTENNFDVIGCVADKIDEEDNVWGVIAPIENDQKLIRTLLPKQNIIIHPTVLMKADVIKSLNGYRNFPSCQDYDLWLRLLSGNYRIGILNENLFQFRRHRKSITATKRFGQILNEIYIRKLYDERCTKGSDSYTETNLHEFLERNGFYDHIISNRENKRLNQYNKGIRMIKSKQLGGVIKVTQALCSKSVRSCVKTSILTRKIKGKYRKGKLV